MVFTVSGLTFFLSTGGGAKFTDGFYIIVTLEHRASSDDHVGAGIGNGLDGFGVHAAVDFQVDGTIADHGANPAYFFELGFNEALPAKAWID